MEEAKYYKTVYGKYWQNQTKKYGYSAYERYLVQLIADSSPKRVFEVGIGTGWPIGAALKKKGITVDGCDLAESSVELAREELENPDGIFVGDVVDYKGENEAYDVVYCVRVSWLIPDFYQTLNKMVSMTKRGGFIVFDVMDKFSIHCLNVRKEDLKKNYYRFLGIDVEEKELFGHHDIWLWRMKKFLRKQGLEYVCFGEREITHNSDRKHTPKVVFRCRKEL